MFARTPMATNLSEFVLSLLSKYGGGALSLVRKGLSSIRGLFGSLRSLVRPLLKEAISFLANKLRVGREKLRETGGKVGSELLRFAGRFLGKDVEIGPEDSEGCEGVRPKDVEKAATKAKSAPVAAAVAKESAPTTSVAMSAILAQPRQEQQSPFSMDPVRTLGPVVGRALIRALSRPRRPRPLSTIRELGLSP